MDYGVVPDDAILDDGLSCTATINRCFVIGDYSAVADYGAALIGVDSTELASSVAAGNGAIGDSRAAVISAGHAGITTVAAYEAMAD